MLTIIQFTKQNSRFKILDVWLLGNYSLENLVIFILSFRLKTNWGNWHTCMQQVWRAICLWCLEVQAAICTQAGCPKFVSYGMRPMLIYNLVHGRFDNLGHKAVFPPLAWKKIPWSLPWLPPRLMLATHDSLPTNPHIQVVRYHDNSKSRYTSIILQSSITLRSGVANYAIFSNTLYDMIVWWWS